jgi:hypothetical protein
MTSTVSTAFAFVGRAAVARGAVARTVGLRAGVAFAGAFPAVARARDVVGFAADVLAEPDAPEEALALEVEAESGEESTRQPYQQQVIAQWQVLRNDNNSRRLSRVLRNAR